MSYSPTILARAEALQAGPGGPPPPAGPAAGRHPPGPAPDGGDRPPPAPDRPPDPGGLPLRQGANQEGALAPLRRENLALQEEERALLTQAGYPADALEDTPLCPLCGDRGWKGGRPCAPAWGTSAARSRSPNSPPCWTWGTSPSKPSAWTTTATRWTPCTAAPPGGHGPHPPGLPAVWGGVPPVPPPEPLPLRGPRPGEDLPVGLHRPDGGGERVLRGLRHRRQRLCPV